jgi:hypothetical protein
MNYAKITQQNEVLVFPVSLQQLLDTGTVSSTNPTVAELAAANIVEVIPVAAPAPDDEYIKELKAVRQPDGKWQETWVRIETSDEYKIAATVRKTQQVLMQRNMRLSWSDWTQMPDVEISDKTAWATYRQALRDVPTQAGFPFSIQWPQPPNR